MRRETVVLTWVLRGVALAIVAAMVYLGFMLVSDRIAERTSSPAGRAAANLAKLVRQKPKDATLRVRLAEALLAAGRKGEAVDQYKAALKLEPKNASALSGLALIAMNDGEWSKSEDYWRRIIEVLEAGEYSLQDQRLEKAYFYLGSVLIEQQRYEEAVGYLRRALSVRRDASDTHYVLSYAYWKLDIPEKRREHLESALRFDPALPEANYDLGTILLAEGDVAGAAERFRASTDRAPDDRMEPFEALQDLGPYQQRIEAARRLRAEKPKAALTEARVAAALEPGSAEAAKLVAQLYEKTGDKNAAREAWDRAARLAPEDPQVIEALRRTEKGKSK